MKYLTVIVLSSVISTLTVLVVMKISDGQEAGDNVPTLTSGSTQTNLNSGTSGNRDKRRVVRNRRNVPDSYRGADTSNVGGKSNISKSPRDLYVVLPEDDLIVSNSYKSIQKYYHTRTRDKGGNGNSVMNEGRGGDSTVQYGLIIAPTDGIKISEPVNPQPGMIAYSYSTEDWMGVDMLKESNSALLELPALKTVVDNSDKFSLNIENGVDVMSMRWDGFIKCKRTVTYTFLIRRDGSDNWDNGYSIRINNDLTATGHGQNAFDVNLKAGWNRMEVVCQFKDKSPLNISYKPKGSLSEPRPIAPKDLYHNQKPEEDW